MDKMHARAAAALEPLFKDMPKEPTIEDLKVDLETALRTLQNIESRANQLRPKGTPRLFLRPTGLLLQALANQFHKDDATEVFKVGE